MIITHRSFLLQNSQKEHARVHVNPVGELDIDIVESEQHHDTDFEHLVFKRSATGTVVAGIDKNNQTNWQYTLSNTDADELNTLVKHANEDFEQLMRDL
ncbi:hypothetical protein [Vibrio mediterranei]|uniref:hypothetical protein n=1 Tax=Vibrio mediterranei TaxID=689 RepID=UPI004067BBD2